jgi:hypothetical protein
MKDFNLAWETFVFHTKQVEVLESDFFLEFKKVKAQKRSKRRWGRRFPIIEMADRLINSYVKLHNAIDELIEFNRYHSLHGVPLPEGKDTSLHSLFGLKNSSHTLINVARKRRGEIIKLFS